MTDLPPVPAELQELLNVTPPADANVTQTWYAVFNDPERIQEQVDLGMPEDLADKLREPLHQTLAPGAAKRYLLWTNENRDTNPELLARSGYALLRTQDVTTTPWRTIEGDELANIDEGRRAYG